MPLTLSIPAIAVTLVFLAVLFGVPESVPLPGRRLDVVGFSLLPIGLLLITSGLAFLRLNGLEAWWVTILIVLGMLFFVPFGPYKLKRNDPQSTSECRGGYPTVWIICGVGALVADVLLFFVPKLAFADSADELPARATAWE